MSDAREKRVPFMMSEKELESVDDWRFKNRISTRADALRRLCKLGMALDVLLPDLDSALQSLLEAATDFNEAAASADAETLSEASHAAQANLAVVALEMGKAIGLMNQKARIAKREPYPSEAEVEQIEAQNREVMKSFASLQKAIRKR